MILVYMIKYSDVTWRKFGSILFEIEIIIPLPAYTQSGDPLKLPFT